MGEENAESNEVEDEVDGRPTGLAIAARDAGKQKWFLTKKHHPIGVLQGHSKKKTKKWNDPKKNNPTGGFLEGDQSLGSFPHSLPIAATPVTHPTGGFL